MWIRHEYPEIALKDMCKVFGLPKFRKKANFCAISSASGIATGVAAFAVITDYEISLLKFDNKIMIFCIGNYFFPEINFGVIYKL